MSSGARSLCQFSRCSSLPLHNPAGEEVGAPSWTGNTVRGWRQLSGARNVWSWVPGLAVARGYRRSWLRGDLVAGIVLSALLVPQGMAYAKLAGLPPVAGLYATLVPLLVYALFGPSRILVLG